jgi:hypothetical protein
MPAAFCDNRFSLLFLNLRHQNIRGPLLCHTEIQTKRKKKWTSVLQIHFSHYIRNKPWRLFPTVYGYDITILCSTWHSESVRCDPSLCFIFTQSSTTLPSITPLFKLLLQNVKSNISSIRIQCH